MQDKNFLFIVSGFLETFFTGFVWLILVYIVDIRVLFIGKNSVINLAKPLDGFFENIFHLGLNMNPGDLTHENVRLTFFLILSIIYLINIVFVTIRNQNLYESFIVSVDGKKEIFDKIPALFVETFKYLFSCLYIYLITNSIFMVLPIEIKMLFYIFIPMLVLSLDLVVRFSKSKPLLFSLFSSKKY
jgi:hypothetical protein